MCSWFLHASNLTFSKRIKVIEELSNGIEADSLEDPEFTVPTRSFSHQAPESLLGPGFRITQNFLSALF